jgi:Fic family protein
VDGERAVRIVEGVHVQRQMFAHSGGRGGYLKTDGNVIVSYESGDREIVLVPPPPNETEFLLTELLARYHLLKEERQTHPLVLIGALIVDLLAIHPVADGNGRLARLLTTHELLSQGYGVARYVSVEQRIFESKNTHYERLYQSQRDWQPGQAHHLALDDLPRPGDRRRLRGLQNARGRRQ